MKKITVTAIALSMAMAMTGCSGNSTETTAASEAETTAAETSAAETSAAETSAAETSAAEDGEVSVMSYEEYMAAELDSKVVIEASVQAKQSWWEDKATVYAQDEDGAYFLYNMACSEEDYEKLVPGATIQVTGYKTEWSGEVEIIDAPSNLWMVNSSLSPLTPQSFWARTSSSTTRTSWPPLRD